MQSLNEWPLYSPIANNYPSGRDRKLCYPQKKRGKILPSWGPSDYKHYLDQRKLNENSLGSYNDIEKTLGMDCLLMNWNLALFLVQMFIKLKTTCVFRIEYYKLKFAELKNYFFIK